MGVDRTVDRATGAGRLNPLHYTGTITTYLVLVIILTGVYLTMFYQFGFEASYSAVEAVESRWISRIVRAAHRYASIGAVVITLIHAWRTFAMDRFRGARWVPWISGIGMTVLLWIAGVTGYWMIWDVRAGPLNDSLVNALSSWSLGLDFLLDMVVTEAAGSGWVFMLILFFIHLLITGVIAWFYWYHVKRLTRRRFLPPREWLWVTGLVLLVVSIVLPIGMLPAFDRTQLVESVPFDPFFLFLLDPALERPAAVTWGAATLVLGVALAVPWLLRRRRPLPPIVIDPVRCTGCTLCVVDCPYRAIEMVPQPEGRHMQLAVIVDDLCVSCGICIGSCPELAMTFGNTPAELLWDELGARVSAASGLGQVEAVFTCERQIVASHLDWHSPVQTERGWSVITPLPCVGMAHPDLVGAARDAGAASVRFVGCPPDDCANLEGNTWLEDRLARDRLPRLSKKLLDVPISIAWTTPGNLLEDTPAAPADLNPRRWARVVVMLAVGLVLLVATTWWNYHPSTPEALIEISLDHQLGVPIMGFADETSPQSGPARLVVMIDGETVVDAAYPLVDADDALTALALERIPASSGTHQVSVVLHGAGESLDLFDDVVALESGQILKLNYRDQPPSQDAEAGRKIFAATSIGSSAGCQICHSTRPGVVLVGPSLYGIADLAAGRVAGLEPEEYLRQSIVDPDAYVVEGFPSGQMLPDFAERLNEAEIDNLVAYLLTLEGSAP